MNNNSFSLWMDSFMLHLFSKRPVDATFAGLHEYNSSLPDVSAKGLEDTLHEIRSLLMQLNTIQYCLLSDPEKIDYDLAKGFLEHQCWERESGYFYSLNPTTYTGEAAFGLVSLFISDFRPTKDKESCLEERMKNLPSFFAHAKDNLIGAHPEWTKRAIEECIGTLNFLQNGIPILSRDENLVVDLSIVTKAVAAVENFKLYLETELINKPVSTLSCGGDTYRKIMQWAHGSDADPLEYADHAEQVIYDTNIELMQKSREMGADSPDDLLSELSSHHPDIDNYLDSYKSLWEDSRKLCEREKLLTWSDFPIEYKPIPEWAETVQPYLYFLFYRCPPRYNRPETYRYHVIPIEKTLPNEEQIHLLKRNNYYVIKTNHVLHHGGIGHHVQNWNAIKAASRIGQIAANDGPARLTMLCSGTLCEGWACYITKVAGSRGFLTPLEELAELASMRRMAARAVVDVRLHYGIYTLEEAADYYQEKAGMPRDFALSEAVKNSLFPGGAIIYLYGIEGIKNLRAELEQKKGSDFVLGDFHDAFLSYGDIPVDRIAQEMRKNF